MMMMETETIRNMSARDLAQLGVNDVAYVKPVEHDDGRVFAIHAADGSQMAVMQDRDLAFATIRQHDLEPLSAH